MSAIDLLSQELSTPETKIRKDLKLNFKAIAERGVLSKAEIGLALLGLGQTLKDVKLREIGQGFITESGETFSEEQITEAHESAAIMGMLNMYYRFRHFLKEGSSEEPYKNTGLRMMALSSPALGKERFEMLAFAISVVNGCEMCVVSHEKALQQHAVSTEKIHELARLAALAKAFNSL